MEHLDDCAEQLICYMLCASWDTWPAQPWQSLSQTGVNDDMYVLCVPIWAKLALGHFDEFNYNRILLEFTEIQEVAGSIVSLTFDLGGSFVGPESSVRH